MKFFARGQLPRNCYPNPYTLTNRPLRLTHLPIYRPMESGQRAGKATKSVPDWGGGGRWKEGEGVMVEAHSDLRKSSSAFMEGGTLRWGQVRKWNWVTVRVSFVCRFFR